MSTTPRQRCFCGDGYACSEHYERTPDQPSLHCFCGAAHVAGACLATEPTTPTPVERAAHAIYSDSYPTRPLSRLSDEDRDEYLDDARKALAAALDVEEIARALDGHEKRVTASGDACWCGWEQPWPDRNDEHSWESHAAAALRASILGGEAR